MAPAAWEGRVRWRPAVDAHGELTDDRRTNADATPNVPDGWTWRPSTSGTVGTIVQDADFFGANSIQIVCNQPSAASELLQNASGNWAAGDVLVLTCKVKVAAASGLSSANGVRADAYYFGGSPLSAPVARGVRLGGLSGTNAKRVTVSPGTTTVQFNIGFTAGATASATYRVGEFAIYNLTRLKLV